MDEMPSISPLRGDVIFTTSRGVERIVSIWVQKKADPLAHEFLRAFTHVAVAVSDDMALEAVPEPNKVPDFVERLIDLKSGEDQYHTPWTEVKLDFGVRVIPIADILVGVHKYDKEIAVLRTNKIVSPEASSWLDLKTLEIVALIGSGYSLDPIHVAIAAKLNYLQAAMMEQAPPQFASAEDLKTLLNLTPEQWKKFEEWAPDSLPAYTSRQFFCSQLVPFLLTRSGYLEPGTAHEVITPIGLFKVLSQLGWSDVTGVNYSPEAVRRIIGDKSSALRCGNGFLFEKQMIILGRQRIAIGAAGDSIAGAMDEMNRNVEATITRLGDMNTDRKDPPKP
jgi:hypothetical protein